MAPSLRASLPLILRPSARLTYALLAGLALSSGTTYAAHAGEVLPATTATAPAAVRVSGVVKDSKGTGIPGVTVVVKGSKTGTITDNNGAFQIELPTGKETLVFSSIGFKTQEIAANGRATIDVALTDDNAALDEVVVVGYGTQSRVSVTGAVATVDMKAIEELPTGSLSAAIQGQQPGVNVAGGTARPGNPGSITIRNPTILSKDGGSLRPLYIIDNVVRTEEDFNTLDQSEVEAISVLKDAAAAIYGARSNQGVVVVATKRGKAGAPKFNYSASVGSTDVVRKPSMMNGVEHATYLNDLNRTAKKPANDPLYYTQDELDHFAQNNYDWLDMAWKPAILTRHALNVSGGSDRATYFAGASYNRQNGNFDNINNEKWTFRASTDVNIGKGLKAGLSLSGDLSERRMYLLKIGAENADNDWRSLINTPQFNPPYVDGLPVYLSSGAAVESLHLFELQKSDNYTKNRTTGLNITANIDYDMPFLKGLKARVLYSRTMDNSFGKQYGTRFNVYQFSMLGANRHIFGGDVVKPVPLSNGDRIFITSSYTNAYQLNGYLNFDRQFGKHSISALALVEQGETHFDEVRSTKDNPIPGAGDNMRFATGAMDAYETETEAGILSYAARINYNFASKYFVELAARYDGSTNFAPEYRWGLFPSLSAGWVMSEEGFFRNNVRFVNFLKLRGSVGLLGGDATRPYSWLENYKFETGKGAVFGGNGDRTLTAAPNNAMANRGVRWDNNIKYNGGIEAQFLNHRLTLSADAFYDHRYNMLTALSASAPLLIGAPIPSENYSTVNGFGYEVSVGYGDKIGGDFSYRVNSFIGWSDNRRVKVDVERGKIGTWEDPTGRPSDQGVQGYKYLGMFRTQEEVDAFRIANPNYTLFGAVPQPGMLYYQDIRGPKDASGQFTEPDGKITEDDQTFITKRANNNYSVGLNPSISFKGLSIQVVMGASFGGQDMVEGDARKQATPTVNRPAFWTDHWTPDNPNAAYPDPFYSGTYDRTSAFWFRNAFSAGMRNATVSYSFPARLVNRVGIASAKVFFVSVNPLNFYNPYDYKVYSGAYNSYPTLRSLSLGLNIGF